MAVWSKIFPDLILSPTSLASAFFHKQIENSTSQVKSPSKYVTTEDHNPTFWFAQENARLEKRDRRAAR
jgi:hypothetical protein